MNQLRALGVLSCALSLLGSAPGLLGQVASLPRAVQTEPVTGILDTFSAHDLVALSDNHGNEQDQALRLALIRHARFALTVNDIVVEFGNALYQNLIDRFVMGEDIPYDTLRQVWHKTTQLSGVWDRPIYEEFFRAVRAVNASLPSERRLRVLLGDPPMNWDLTPVNYQDMLRQRDSYPAELIRREVLARGHRALVIYGGAHLLRKGDGSLRGRPLSETLVGRLESVPGRKVFTIWVGSAGALQTLQDDAASWPAPSFAAITGTVMGGASYSLVSPVYAINPFAVRPDGTPLRMEDQYDAVVSLGSKLTERPGVGPPHELIDRIKNDATTVAPR